MNSDQAISKQYKARESGNVRLFPPRFHTRYYSNRLLASEMRELIKDWLPASPVLGDGSPGSSSAKELCTLVDFGCGEMPYQPLFEEAGVKYIGADLHGNMRADIEISEDGRMEYASNTCDVVLSSQVLEHVFDPEVYLSECFRILRPGGRLFLSTHGYWKFHPDPNDFWRWTSQGLRHIVNAAGFEVERQKGLIGRGAAGIHLFQDATLESVHHRLRPLYGWFFQRCVAVADRMHSRESRDRDAMFYVIVARKGQAL